MRILRRLNTARELHEVLSTSTSLVIGAAAVIFALVVAMRITDDLGITSNVVVLALTVMFSMKLIGFLMLTLRHEAISQILGILVLENGIFLGTQILVPGMPLMIELVLLFDLLVAVACFGVLVRYLLTQIGSTSSRELEADRMSLTVRLLILLLAPLLVVLLGLGVRRARFSEYLNLAAS
ncbi:hypothetical protein, partial [Rhodanobacter lindaniclasticus]